MSAKAWDDIMDRYRDLERQVSYLRSRNDRLTDMMLERGLREPKEATPAAEPEQALPIAIQQALGQWPEGSAPYVANLQYAHAQLAIRPDDAEGIAAEIKAGEDVEMFT